MKKIIYEVISLFMLVFIIIALYSTCSCNGNSAKLADHFKQTKKNQEEIKAEQKVQGDNNTQEFTKISQSVETTIQNTTKVNEQLENSNKVQAEKIDKLVQETENNVNSSWMVWGITGLMAVIVIVAICGIIFTTYLLIKNISRVNKAIDDDSNTLTKEQWNDYKKDQ